MEQNGFEIVPYYMETNNNNQKTGVKMKHTQGKWEISESEDISKWDAEKKEYVKDGRTKLEVIDYVENEASAVTVCMFPDPNSHEGDYQNKVTIRANANLIALAPEMCDALNNILNYFSEYEDDYNEKLECFENARKVIDRAEEK